MSLTRARYALYIVGHIQTLQQVCHCSVQDMIIYMIILHSSRTYVTAIRVDVEFFSIYCLAMVDTLGSF